MKERNDSNLVSARVQPEVMQALQERAEMYGTTVPHIVRTLLASALGLPYVAEEPEVRAPTSLVPFGEPEPLYHTVTAANGMEILVSEDDIAHVNSYNWHALRKGSTHHYYPCRVLSAEGGKVKRARLSHEITGCTRVWHANNNGMDCRRENLLVRADELAKVRARQERQG